ncbi:MULTISPECIES: DUF1810 domain-containing protein [Shinella]|uniref:DUF1810 domain-containing protein n=1 Tax=Shinella sedimenti TaxID=2919913 RepID=A0ABT0CTQ5_9HYPH|nr:MULTISPECIES: DUF1810 domain-containing protein [Shinella]MCJ8152003.1 DUF1810 domain-containing protein [Shinella sedimenti]
MDDPFQLNRFVEAQEPIFSTALGELRAGRKQTHWMWFIFPQLRALGRSPTAELYGIASLDEARAYLLLPVLAGRLVEAIDAVLMHHDRPANAIFGSPDDLKFRSSMTLFDAAADHDNAQFRIALERFYSGKPDERTLQLLGCWSD